MKPEAQRIAIAEACPNILFLNLNEGWCYRTSSKSEWIGCVNNDPLSDLNAMHEAEKVLTDEQFEHYEVLLANVAGNTDSVGSLQRQRCKVSATAAQRAEAFLRTLNLWKP